MLSKITVSTKQCECPAKNPDFPCGFNPENVTYFDSPTEELHGLLACKDNVLYELLQGDYKKKLYFDIDYTCADNEEYEKVRGTILKNTLTKLTDTLPDVQPHEIYVSSYCGEDLNIHYKNKKHGKWLVSYHLVVNRLATLDQNRQLGTYLKQALGDIVDTQVYRQGYGILRYGKSHKYTTRKKGCRVPVLMYWNPANSEYTPFRTNTKLPNNMTADELRLAHLITNVNKDTPVLNMPVLPKHESPAKSKPPTSKSDEPASANLDATDVDPKLLEVLKCIPQDACDDYGGWRKVGCMCKALGQYGAWYEWSKQSHKFDASVMQSAWKSMKGVEIYEASALRVLKKMGKNSAPVSSDMLDLHETWEENTDRAHAKFVVQKFGHLFRVVSDKLIYRYNTKSALWEQTTKDCLFGFFMSGAYQELLEEYTAELRARPECFFELEDAEDTYGKKISSRVALLKVASQTKTLNAWSKFILADDQIRQDNFCTKLNSIPHLLSVKNGVVDLRTKTWRPREYQDCFSQQTDIEYNPDLPSSFNAPFVEFIESIFDHPSLQEEEGEVSVAEYCKLWLGYCITGNTNLQRCAIWQGGGSNGKSLLQEILYNVLRTSNGPELLNTWSSKFIDELSNSGSNNSATPELAKMESVRMGFINELKEDVKIDSSFKQFIDSTDCLAVRANYQDPKLIQVMCVFNLFCNLLPHIPSDHCYKRRVMIIPLLNTYVVNPTKPNEKQIDFKLKAKVLTDEKHRQAVLSWLVEGAAAYYQTPELLQTQPKCCSRILESHMAEHDYMECFEYSENESDFVSTIDAIALVQQRLGLKIKTRDVNQKFRELTNTTAVRKTVNGRRQYGYKNMRIKMDLPDDEAQPLQFQ